MKSFSKPFLALLVLVVTVFGPVACGASEAVVAQKSVTPVAASKNAGALSISTTALPSGVDRNIYLAVVEATGGTPGYTWSISAGNLPSGLLLIPATGLITGTPKESGTSTFTLAVSDKGKPMQTVTKSFSITTLVPLAITTSSLSSAVTQSTYSTTLQASGGMAPYVWSISSGRLPSGLTLDSISGRIAGTPGVSGTSTFSVTVVDHGNLVQNFTRTFSISTIARLAITTSILASPVSGFAYTAALQDTGGVTPYTWSVSSGSLPAGLSLNAATGVISGTPTASGTSNFVATVTDSGNPEQSTTEALSLSIIGQLSVPSTAMPAGTSGVAYAAKMPVSGGVPAYTWSLVSGSLPNGLSLAGTTGVVSGTPNAPGTFNFAIRVVDNGSPTQALTLRSSIKVNPAPIATPATLSIGTTWYVRLDGGSRYSSYATSGQCDGKADAPYSGVGTNQHCAFNDYRFLWDDQAQYGVLKWVIAGGDTVILDNKTQWRVGFDVSSGGDPSWCRGGLGTYGCTNPPIPAGTAGQHTRILGRNWATCHNGHVADRTQMTQIFGGHGVYTPMNLASTQYVDLACLEITRHSQCTVGGQPSYGKTCTTADDYDSDGVEEDQTTANVTMTDLWIHNHPGRGVKGPIGGPVVATNVTIGYNESAGWDFDDGYSTPFGAGASWTFNYSTIEWSGCYQEYPIVHANPALACYGQSNQGYGDGVGTAPGQELDVAIDHSTFRYNTQDGEDFGHVDGGTHSFSVTNSISYGNNGAAFKWGWGFTNIVFENNVAVANCRRMAAPIAGTPSSFNTNLGDFCRSGDALSFNFEDGTKALFANNTIITYAGVTFDEQCVPIGGSQGQTNCSSAVFTLKNNLIRGYSNPAYDYGGNYAPATFCGNGCNNSTLPIGTINRDHNMFYGFRGTCIANTQTPGSNSGTSTNETCDDPMFTGEPTSFTTEATLDDYILDLTSGSPARGTGTMIQGLTTDYIGVTYATPPSMGALEYKAGEVVSTSTPIQ